MKKKLSLLVLAVAVVGPVWAEGISYDPYEGYNRFMFRVNDNLDRHVLVPVAKGYRKVTPSPVRTGVRNFFNNLRDVVSFGSNVLRLDIEKAGTDLVRVGINSTFGLGGLIDIAGAGQIPNNKNTLGDTFASWGWKNSNYFVYPLTGPSTVRDSVGNTVTYAYSVNDVLFTKPGVRYGTAVLNGINKREAVLDLTDSLDEVSLDSYAYVRDMYMGMRNRQVGNTAALEEEIDIDSLVPVDQLPDDTTPASNDPFVPQDDRMQANPESHHATATDADGAITEVVIDSVPAAMQDEVGSLAYVHAKYINYWPVESVQ